MGWTERLFNWKKGDKDSVETFAEPNVLDSTVENYGGARYSYLTNIRDTEETRKLIKTYRQLAIEQEVDEIITDIADEAVSPDDEGDIVKIDLQNVDQPDNIKKKIEDEFDEVLNLLDFRNSAHDIFKRFYIDGRLAYHKVSNKQKNDIIDLVQLDPLYLSKATTIKRSDTDNLSIDLSTRRDRYIYETENNNEIEVDGQHITFITSGLISSDGRRTLSYLFKSIKPFNNLNALESSAVIYRITRAPERMAFLIDIGNSITKKSLEFLEKVKNKYKTNVTYNPNSTELNNNPDYMVTAKDYWLPRVGGTQTTEVSRIDGGNNLGEIKDIEYFSDKLYRSQGAALNRFKDSQPFSDVSIDDNDRDENRFNKLINRHRTKFNALFFDILRTKLILKNIVTAKEWDKYIKQHARINYMHQNVFTESRTLSNLSDRFRLIDDAQGVVGKYYSHDTIRRKILNQSDSEIREEDRIIKSEGEQFITDDDDEIGK